MAPRAPYGTGPPPFQRRAESAGSRRAGICRTSGYSQWSEPVADPWGKTVGGPGACRKGEFAWRHDMNVRARQQCTFGFPPFQGVRFISRTRDDSARCPGAARGREVRPVHGGSANHASGTWVALALGPQHWRCPATKRASLGDQGLARCATTGQGASAELAPIPP